MHGRERVREVDADARGLERVERSSRRDALRQRLSLHELHPHAHPAGDTVSAVHGDDVGVAYAGERAALGDHVRVALGLPRRVLGQQLERHLTIEARVPRPIHVAERPASEILADDEPTPRAQGGLAGGVGRRGHGLELAAESLVRGEDLGDVVEAAQ